VANFNTHLAGAALGSGILATFCYNAQLTDPDHSAILWVIGTLAGLLPDVDSNNSTSLKIIFNALSMMIAALLIIRMSRIYSLLWISCTILATYLTLRWAVLPIFKKVTVHRGGWHTLLAGACISMTIINLSWYSAHTTALFAWLLGIATSMGFAIHLVLDEIYSFDLSNLKIKRSFGTACKLINIKTPLITCIIVTLTTVQLWYLPPLTILIQATHQLARVNVL